MKTQLKLEAHSGEKTSNVIELWYEDTFVGTVTGADGPGIRIHSQYPRHKMFEDEVVTEIAIGEVTIRKE